MRNILQISVISMEERINNLANKSTDFHKYPRKGRKSYESREAVRRPSVYSCMFYIAAIHRGLA